MADPVSLESSSTRLKDIFPEIASKTGIPEKHVAAICRQLLLQIQDTIEKGKILRSKNLVFKSVAKKNDQAQESQNKKPQVTVGRVIVKAKTEGKNSDQND